MIKKRVAIYDLYNTLIDTENLKKLRDEKKWGEIYNNFNLTYLNPKVKSYIENLNKKIFNEFVIVTSSHKLYAQKLLKYHNFLIGCKIIAYHDTSLRKPYPNPYLKALEQKEFDEVYIFGDQVNDFIAADKLQKILIDKKVYKVGCTWYYENNIPNLDRLLNKKDLNINL